MAGLGSILITVGRRLINVCIYIYYFIDGERKLYIYMTAAFRFSEGCADTSYYVLWTK